MKNKTSLTIGYILPNLVGDYHRIQWSAVNRKSIEENVNLIIFSPFMFYSHYAYKKDFFKTFELAGPENIQGLIISSGSLNVFCDSRELDEISHSYGSLPIVSIAEDFAGIPSILIDNKQGMFDMVEHFIKVHQYKKIAFLAGPDNNQEAELRLSAYKEAMEKYNLPVDERYIVEGDFSLPSGRQGVVELLDNRKLELEAIVAANDDMILGALSELKARGIRVPEDIAIAGFDNQDSVQDADPPIASVNQPFGEQAEKATELLLSMIRGERIPGRVVLPARPVFRASCGCKEHSGKEDYVAITKKKTLEATEKGYDVGNLSSFYTSIMNALSFDVVYEQYDKLLRKVDIPSSYISFYNKGTPVIVNKRIFPPAESEVVFAFRDNQLLDLEEEEEKFATLDIVPDKQFFRKQRRSIVCSELIFQREHYGFIVFEITPGIDPLVFHLILLQMTSCLQSIYIHKELEKAFQKLQELDKAKTNFFANISHEFRTPLTLMLSPLESIVQGDYGINLKSDDEILQAMLRNGFRLLKLINNLLDFTKIEAGKMSVKKKRTDMVKLLTFYTSSIYSGASSLGISINFKNDTDEAVIAWVDRDLIEKAFFNLVSNALKFTPKGGTIAVVLKKNRDRFTITVKDSGIGIKKEKINMIFERFSQADEGVSRKYEGTGIGLAFTQEIIKLHNGVISVSSEWGKGSAFTMDLPLSSGEMENEESIEEAIEDMEEVKSYLIADFKRGKDDDDDDGNTDPVNPSGSMNDILAEDENDEDNSYDDKKHDILVCDDNADMRRFLKTLLKREYNIITAKNGLEGLQKARKIQPTLILSDVMMPEMSGYELCNEVKKDDDLKHIPVILITAKADVSMKIEGFEYGADDYLSKPFNSRELLLRIKVFINREELRKELEEKNAILSEIARQDSLTGLLNHAAVLEQFHSQFRDCKRHRLPISTIMMDIDHFKGFNDTYGHSMGDRVIEEVALVIKSIFRAHDIKGRYGGDEFTLILPRCGKDDIMELFERLFCGIKEICIMSEGKEIRVTSSIGIAVLDGNPKCDDPRDLLELADQALYIAKERGRDQGCILLFSEEGYEEIFIEEI